MRNETMLEMLNNGEYEMLKELLKQEIYKKSIGTDARKRLAAMKKYFKYGNAAHNLACTMPYLMEDENTAFCDGYTAVITTEKAEGMKHYADGNYMDVKKYFPNTSEMKQAHINLAEYIAKAKTDGYKYSQKTFSERKYVFKMLNNAYFNIGYIDKVVSILDDGNGFDVYYIDNKKAFLSPIVIKTSLGKGIILPFRYPTEGLKDGIFTYNAEL